MLGSVISGFRRDAYEICVLLGYYAALNGNSLPTFRATYRSHLQGSRSPRGSICWRGKKFSSCPQCPDRMWSPPSFLSSGSRGLFQVLKCTEGEIHHPVSSCGDVKNDWSHISAPTHLWRGSQGHLYRCLHLVGGLNQYIVKVSRNWAVFYRFRPLLPTLGILFQVIRVGKVPFCNAADT
jgi:hypothetical protein